MVDFIRWLVTTMLLAWGGFAILRLQRQMISFGRGWLWVLLAGFIALAHWPINFWLGNPLICPIIVTALYLLSLIGLAPDDSVLATESSALSNWFKRGLVAAVSGSAVGVALWGLML